MAKQGRPLVTDSSKTVSLLVTSFHSGLNVREACLQSGISHEAYYNRLRRDKKFADKMSIAQLVPTLNAKITVVKAINEGNVRAAQWWLERKAKDEFSTKIETTFATSSLSSPIIDLSEAREAMQQMQKYQRRKEKAKQAKYPLPPTRVLAQV